MKVRVLSTKNNKEKEVKPYENAIVPSNKRGNFEFAIETENH
jgi:hypothetical protein